MACKYNMKGESTAAKQKVEDVDDSAAVPTIRGELKAAFAAGDVSTRDFRMRQLLKFRDMLVAGRGPLLDALQQDLHKSHTEGWMMELNQLEHEAQEAIDSLGAWMRPERVGTNVVNVPGASYVHSDPLGVVLVIGGVLRPERCHRRVELPVLLSLAPVVGAIAAGNGVVLKLPSDKYSAATSAAIADLAVLDARWDHIFFTGGKTVGRMVAKAAAEHLCPTSLELGGKSPCVVDKSCGVAVAARRICWGLFTNCGQTCVRPDYLLVDEAIADAFLRALKAEVAAFWRARPSRHTTAASSTTGPSTASRRSWPTRASGAAVHGGATDKATRFKTFSHQKAVLHKTPYLDLPARYPPYDSTKETMLAVLQHPRYGPDRLLSLVPPAVKKALGVAAAVYVAKKLAPAVLAASRALSSSRAA
ncbi:hypothetical protein JL722_14148 [Aureococcus anophagefferens]|nr:hypothetical protein JL722_14148 [Aureococcus anophagefferens]